MELGLLLTAFGLGLRHGVDWDHIAAIADLSGSAEHRRRGFWLSFLYAVGHAVVVLILGTAAILFSASIPESLDVWMGRIVGLTLIWLGVWVITQLIRQGRDFRLQSRWMLVLSGTFAGLRRVRAQRGQREITVEHDHDHQHGGLGDGGGADTIDLRTASETLPHDHQAAHDHAHNVDAAVSAAEPVGAPRRRRGFVFGGASDSHSHSHSHQLALPTSAAPYGSGTATGIGMLHGVGVESPTQIAVFVASTSLAGATAGLSLLVAWVVGLIIANSVLALLASAGLLQAERNFGIYATLAVVVAVLSIAMGVMFVSGIDLAGPLAAL